MNALRLEIKEIFSLFSEAEKKAIKNTIVVPVLLLILTSNVLISLCWILMLVVIYTTIQKDKIENGKMFFTFLKYEILIMSFVLLVNIHLIIE